eukprot:2447052-Amphidinium_carterae.2
MLPPYGLHLIAYVYVAPSWPTLASFLRLLQPYGRHISLATGLRSLGPFYGLRVLAWPFSPFRVLGA